MTEDELLAQWAADRHMFEAWGSFVVDEIVRGVNEAVSPMAADLFLRIPPKARVKQDVSFVEKAFYRKNYDDPYEQITDKVGVRFVVLLTSDLKIVEQAITSSSHWQGSKDRDFEEEQSQSPLQFDYAAIHYVVRCKGDKDVGGVIIRDGSPCEVQVKTILQHAYSELTHDTIYKPRVDATPQMRRAAAKSMALIEATNDYFEEVTRQVEAVTKPERYATEALKVLYHTSTSREPEVSRLEGVLLDALEIDGRDGLIDAVTEMLRDKPFIGERIAARAESKLMFRQPSILIAYLYAQDHAAKLKELWPLTPDELRPVFVDLGLAFDGV